MAWYGRGSWDYFPPYVSVAEKKAHGAQALAKLLKKNRRTPEPVVAPRGAHPFWGQAWADNPSATRTRQPPPRGRAYLRNSSVLTWHPA
jgi:hypothetical protein